MPRVTRLDPEKHPNAGTVVKVSETESFLYDELYAAFHKVCDKSNWKEPIDYTGWNSVRQCNLIHFAVPFFTGGKCSIEVLKSNPDRLKIRVTAQGYYYHCGA